MLLVVVRLISLHNNMIRKFLVVVRIISQTKARQKLVKSCICIYAYVYMYMYICICIYVYVYMYMYICNMQHTATHCNTLHHTATPATHCTTLQHTIGKMYICKSICVCGPVMHVTKSIERWGAGVETQKNVRREIGGWGRVPFNEPYAPSLSTIYDGA